MNHAATRGRPFYGWTVVAAAFGVLFLALSMWAMLSWAHAPVPKDGSDAKLPRFPRVAWLPVLAILWMLMPFFVWRIARHSKKTAARSLQISRSLELLDGTSARIENSIRQAAATGSAENRRQS